MNKFSKGDKVTVRPSHGTVGLACGTVYTVVRQFVSFGADFVTLEGKHGEWRANRFEKVKAQAKFSTGERVIIRHPATRHVGRFGIVKQVHEGWSASRPYYYTVDVERVGIDHGGLWEDVLERAWVQPSEIAAEKPAAKFAVGDRVMWTDGKVTKCPGTVIQVLDAGAKFRVKFDGLMELIYDAKWLTALTTEKPKASKFDAAVIAAQAKAGKLAKLQRLAKELGYVVTPA